MAVACTQNEHAIAAAAANGDEAQRREGGNPATNVERKRPRYPSPTERRIKGGDHAAAAVGVANVQHLSLVIKRGNLQSNVALSCYAQQT